MREGISRFAVPFLSLRAGLRTVGACRLGVSLIFWRSRGIDGTEARVLSRLLPASARFMSSALISILLTEVLPVEATLRVLSTRSRSRTLLNSSHLLRCSDMGSFPVETFFVESLCEARALSVLATVLPSPTRDTLFLATFDRASTNLESLPSALLISARATRPFTLFRSSTRPRKSRFLTLSLPTFFGKPAEEEAARTLPVPRALPSNFRTFERNSGCPFTSRIFS